MLADGRGVRFIETVFRRKTERRKRGPTPVAPPKRPRSVKSRFLSPVLPALRPLCELLRKSHKQGIIIGGVASSVLGRARLTVDIDATVVIDEVELALFLAQAAIVGLTSRHASCCVHAPNGYAAAAP